jgi:hypothetical protein
MISTSVSIQTTPTLMVPSDNKWRKIYIHNSGGQKIYIGGSTVSTSTGFHLGNGESIEFDVPLGETLYAVVASSTNAINVLTPDLD